MDPSTGKIMRGVEGKIQIEIKGVDVYDPTTGQIRSASTDDIACWLIDTDYNGESSCARPISPGPMNPTTSSNGRYGRTSTKRPGAVSTAR